MLLSKLQMAVNDEYDFLGLPDQGASAPGDLVDPVGYPLFSPSYIDDYAGFTLPTVQPIAPRPEALTGEEIGQFMLGVRPFERGLSTTGLVTPDEERDFVEGQLSRARSESSALANEIAAAQEELQIARSQQDVIREQAAQERLAALADQRSRFEAQIADLEAQLGTQAEAFASERTQFQDQISSITAARDAALAERDQALANNDIIRAQSAEAQAQSLAEQKSALEAQYRSQITGLEGQLSERDATITGYEQQIADLQAQLDALQSSSSPSDESGDSDDIYMEPSLDEDMEEFYADQVRDEDVGAQTTPYGNYQSPYANMSAGQMGAGQQRNMLSAGLGSMPAVR